MRRGYMGCSRPIGNGRGLDMEIVYGRTEEPEGNRDYIPVDLTEETMDEHFRKVLGKMEEEGLDTLVIYGDREHGANFAYLTGFEPRFEESVLVMHKDGSCYLLLGNENLKMAEYSFVKAEVVHVPYFSLPCQPMGEGRSLTELMASAGIRDNRKIGCAGWKYFTERREEKNKLFDIPAFLMDVVREINIHGETVHAGGIFLHPLSGVRHIVNANELAHYEFGAGLASARLLEAYDSIEPGGTEMEVADRLSAFGQPTSVTTICAAGARFTGGVVFPRNKKIALGDKFSLTLGLRGGLSSRASYVAEKREDLPQEARDYLEKVAIPYYKAAVTWFEMIGIGASCGDVYRKIEEVLPKEEYHWVLNPGHFTGQEEWTASPFYPASPVVLQSGMLLQMDIIPSVPGYGGAGAEDGIAIADEKMQKEIKEKYPQTWARMEKRKKYMRDCLGICLRDEVFPMSDMCGYFRPYILKRDYALRKRK